MNIKNNIKISVVSPVYRGEKMVAELVRRNVEVLSSITEDYEIILVNDASPDNSWQTIEAECKKNPRVKGLNLSRNFGQHYAITAGLSYASGEWVVVMDCDLQDRLEEIPNLYAKAQEGTNKQVFAYCPDGIAKGLITVDYKGNKAQIGLVAVDTQCQHQGIGTRIMSTLERGLFEEGVMTIDVATQKANTDACRWYEKNGIKVKSVTPIYHWWL